VRHGGQDRKLRFLLRLGLVGHLGNNRRTEHERLDGSATQAEKPVLLEPASVRAGFQSVRG
jgi:hypothetical protein